MKKVMQGNEAIARGAWEAGVTVAAAYPGTPSSEILQEIARSYGKDIYAEWSPNEKVAMEVGAGAAIAGARSVQAFVGSSQRPIDNPGLFPARQAIAPPFVP